MQTHLGSDQAEMCAQKTLGIDILGVAGFEKLSQQHVLGGPMLAHFAFRQIVGRLKAMRIPFLCTSKAPGAL